MSRLLPLAAFSLLLPAAAMAAAPETPRIPLVEDLMAEHAFQRKDGAEEQEATVTAATAAAAVFRVEFHVEGGRLSHGEAP